MLRWVLINKIPDIYCMMRLGASKSVRTSIRTDNLAPEWGDFVMYYDMDQKDIYIYDKVVTNSNELLRVAEIMDGTCKQNWN